MRKEGKIEMKECKRGKGGINAVEKIREKKRT